MKIASISVSVLAAVLIALALLFSGKKNENEKEIKNAQLGVITVVFKNDARSLEIPQKQPVRATSLSQLFPSQLPRRYYTDMWYNEGYTGNFTLEYHGEMSGGIGFFIPSKDIDGYGQDTVSYCLNEEFETLTFTPGCEKNWCAGYDYGYYAITVFGDGKQLYSSGYCDYFTRLKRVKLDLSGINELSINLEQFEGTKGTLCIVLGDVILN